MEPDSEQVGGASDDIVWISSQDGSLGNEEEADSTQEAGVEFYNMNGLMTRKGGRSLVFHCDGED